jgi:tyrosyl-tRNA synthetase
VPEASAAKINPQAFSLDEQLQWLQQGTQEIVPLPDLAAKLKRSEQTGKPLRVKLGMDPTRPDLHLGHAIVLRKLRQFQDLGHDVFLIIGDFTAMVGDPTGRSETRKPLTREEIRDNAQTYADQVFIILDPDHTQVVYNNDWLGSMGFAQVVDLTARYTVARLLERDDFSKRFSESRPIACHEFLYAFSQSYDSVHLRSDVELGGTDQRFNILMARDIQGSYGLEPQVGVFCPILVGTDGVQKMSKSLDNYVGLTESAQGMFDKLMSVSDETMVSYYRYLTDLPEAEYGAAIADQPMEAKKQLGRLIAATYHDRAQAEAARAEWERVHSARQAPEQMPEVVLPADVVKDGKTWIARLLVSAALVQGSREGRRMVEQGGVQVDGERVTDPDAEIEVRDGMVVQVGRRKFARIRLS